MTKHYSPIGSNLDDMLRTDGALAKANGLAIKRVLTWQLEQEMQRHNITKAEMARRMGTSRAALDRLFDARNVSITLTTIGRAAAVLGKQIHFKMVSA
jgi:predicted XRE-type DNA-binding protein